LKASPTGFPYVSTEHFSVRLSTISTFRTCHDDDRPSCAAIAEVNTTELLTELPDCVVVLDGSGHVQWGNRAAERLFGRSLRDSIGLRAFDLVYHDDLELVLRSFESVQRKEVGTLIEVRAETPTGWRLLEVLGAPICWSGKSDAVLFCMRDLTDRRRFEVAQGQDATFRTVVQNSPDMTILLSPSGKVNSASGALSRILGHDPEVIEGQPIVAFMIEDDQRHFLESMRTASQSATASNPLKIRVRLSRYDSGEPVPFEFSLVNLLDDPSVAGFVVSARDITTQVVAERVLRQTEQRFRGVFDQSPVGIVLTDFEQTIIDANHAFCLLVGQSSEEVIGATLQSFVHPDDREETKTAGQVLLRNPRANHKSEARFGSKNGNSVLVSVTGSVMLGEDGTQLLSLWVIQDITERRILERELLDHASTASKLLASFTSRECEVLGLLAVTTSASQIADRLTLSVRTVETHLANAYRKLGVHNRASAEAEYARLTRAVSGAPPHWTEHESP
jgi:PAS domain S-box-containing protein